MTSERFLDERLHRYPSTSHGGNGRDLYADVEAVRVSSVNLSGPENLLREAWQRYCLPIAVTEVHLGCTRDEQMRWLSEVWNGCNRLLEEGLDVRALTVWSLFGAFDWDSLLTRRAGHYESGAFDLSGEKPRPTAITTMIRDLAAGRGHRHAVLSEPGWWKRDVRMVYPDRVVSSAYEMHEELPPDKRVILISGATGTLGKAFARICELRGLPYVLLSRCEMGITNNDSIRTALRKWRPWALVNAAGYVRVDDAEDDPGRCYTTNSDGPANLALACSERDIQLLTFSSDLVFDGAKSQPYVEIDKARPLNVYGHSKLMGESRVLEHAPNALVVRTSAFFGPWDRYSFLYDCLRTVAEGRLFRAAGDSYVSPTYVPDLVNASLDLLIDRESGIWHLANQGEVTWAELAKLAAQRAGLSGGSVLDCSTQELGFRAKRPSYSVLGSRKCLLLPELEHALERFVQERDVR